MKRNIIAALALLSIASCTKKDSTNVSPSTLKMADLGYTYEKQYTMYFYKKYSTGSSIGFQDTLVFHSNNTITETYKGVELTYNVSLSKSGDYTIVKSTDTVYRPTLLLYNRVNYDTVYFGTFPMDMTFDVHETPPVYVEYYGKIF